MRLSIKVYLLSALLTTTLLLAGNPKSTTSSQEILPSVLSSATQIKLLQPITIKPDIPLYTPQLTNKQNCRVYKKNKKHKEKHKSKEKNDAIQECSYSGDAPKQLAEFAFRPTTNNSTLSITKNQTLKKANLPSLNITKAKTKLTFKAPKNKDGRRVQHIGAIVDSSRVSTYIFHQGDYYIDSLKIESQADKKNDLFTLKTKGKVRIFLNQDSYIIKRDDAYKKRGYIELGYHKNPSNLIILSKNNLTIDASRRLKAHSIIYGYSDLNLICNKNSTVKGAVHANGTLAIGKDIAKHWKQEEAGEFVYDGRGVGRLDLGFDVEESTDSVAPIITLNGDSNITLLQDETYQELGATAIDDIDGNVSVEISGDVDSATVGSYIVTYTAIDNAGNEASVSRTVNIKSSEPTLVSLVLSMKKTDFTRMKRANSDYYTDIKEPVTVIGTYSDGHSEEVTDNVQWEGEGYAKVIKVVSNYLRTKIGEATLTASIGDIKSNTLNITVQNEAEGRLLELEILNKDKERYKNRDALIYLDPMYKPTSDVKLKCRLNESDGVRFEDGSLYTEITFSPTDTHFSRHHLKLVDQDINNTKPYTIITEAFESNDTRYSKQNPKDIVVESSKIELLAPDIQGRRGAIRGVLIKFSVLSKHLHLKYTLIDPPKGMKIVEEYYPHNPGGGTPKIGGVNVEWDVPMDIEEKIYTITMRATDIEGETASVSFDIKVPKTKPIETEIVNNELIVTDKNSNLYGMKMKGHNGEDISDLRIRSVAYGDVWKKKVKDKKPEDVEEYIVFILDNMPKALDMKAPILFDTNEKWIKTGAKIYKYYPGLYSDLWEDNHRVYSGAVQYDGVSSYVIPHKTSWDTNNSSKVFMFILSKAQNKGAL